MKAKKGVYRGSRVRYFEHSLGVVNAKRPWGRVFMGSIMMVGLLGFGAFNLLEKRAENTVLRSDTVATTSTVAQSEDQKLQETPKRATEDKALAKEISRKLSDIPGGNSWSVYVRDLQSERMANIRSDKDIEAAGLQTVAMLPGLENRTAANYWTSRLGSQTINKCVEQMLKMPNETDCTNSIGNYVGWNRFNDFNETQGLKDTDIQSPKKQSTTTAREMGDLLYRLQNSQILSDKARRTVFDGLYAQKNKDGVPAGCGTSCLVAHKTGESSNVKHDAAIVTHDKSKYIVVIMATDKANWSQIAELEKMIDKAMRP